MKNSLHFMIDYCKEHKLDSLDMHPEDIMEMMDAYGDQCSNHTQELVMKTVTDNFNTTPK